MTKHNQCLIFVEKDLDNNETMVKSYKYIMIKFNFIFFYEDDLQNDELKKTRIVEQKCSLKANGIVLKDSKGNSVNQIIITN